jgi:hypothetical protein
MRTTCPIHLIRLDFITLIIFREACRLCTDKLRHLKQIRPIHACGTQPCSVSYSRRVSPAHNEVTARMSRARDAIHCHYWGGLVCIMTQWYAIMF